VDRPPFAWSAAGQQRSALFVSYFILICGVQGHLAHVAGTPASNPYHPSQQPQQLCLDIRVGQALPGLVPGSSTCTPSSHVALPTPC
jgi:hypothetical protein